MNSDFQELVNLFFKDLKQYNTTNFRTIKNTDLAADDPVVHKSFSAVVTRFFIFCERHPELTKEQLRMLYFKLRIDIIARYFSEYPAASLEDLRPFQCELERYVERQHVEVGESQNDNALTVSSI